MYIFLQTVCLQKQIYIYCVLGMHTELLYILHFFLAHYLPAMCFVRILIQNLKHNPQLADILLCSVICIQPASQKYLGVCGTTFFSQLPQLPNKVTLAPNDTNVAIFPSYEGFNNNYNFFDHIQNQISKKIVLLNIF